MTKSKFNKKKLIPFLVILTLVLLGVFNLNSVYAIHMGGDGATFYPDDEHPIQYGVFIPTPNMYATMSIDASNQGQYTIMDWKNTFPPIAQETVSYPGEDISVVYPWYFDDYMKKTPTINDYINPWIDIDWLNVTAYNPHNVNLSSYTLNIVFNYHVMIEGTSPVFPLNNSIPFQIDLVIKNPGPKVLKVDWLTINPSTVSWDYHLISPSDQPIVCYDEIATYDSLITTMELFEYIVFVAKETGTYRLLIDADHTYPADLNLEFLSSSISNLALNKLISIGNCDEDPNLLEQTEIEWQSSWVKISGKKGEFYQVYLGEDFVGTAPEINMWLPHEDGYYGASIYLGTWDLYFPTSGVVYISFVDTNYGDFYRYSLFLNKMDVLDYNIGDNLTSIRISREQHKPLKFAIEKDSFVRFNFTSYDQPSGIPYIGSSGNPFFIYEDSKSLSGSALYYPIETKEVDSETFYYYYFPAGTYFSIIQNTNINFEGVFEISSKYVDFINETIPINALSYLDINASQFLTLEFEPDEYFESLKQGIGIGLNITELGQYMLNVTISASDNLAEIPTSASPSIVLVYNASTPEPEYYDYTTEALTLDGQSFKALADVDDCVYMAYSSKWHDMHINLTQGLDGLGGPDNRVEAWNGDLQDWDDIIHTDDTQDLQYNGSIILNLYDPQDDWIEWVRGCDFDIDDIDEDEYYWLRIRFDSGTITQIPYIDFIEFSNITTHGHVTFALVRESGYNYSDYWEPMNPFTITSDPINQESTYLTFSTERWILDHPIWSQPYINGFEEGFYKFLVIPEGWAHPGSLKIQIAVENYWSYRHQETYNISAISPEPQLYGFQINNYNESGYGQVNESIYSYGLPTTYNHTEASVLGVYSYFALECYGNAYQWTQLVANMQNATFYNLYIMQDLLWDDGSGPNNEVNFIDSSGGNSTFEFGVFSDYFILLFEVFSIKELVTFRLRLSQYNTTMLTTSVPIASYKPPTDYGPWILGLAIGIPVAAGIIVIIYVLKKKGRILTKTP